MDPLILLEAVRAFPGGTYIARDRLASLRCLQLVRGVTLSAVLLLFHCLFPQLVYAQRFPSAGKGLR